METQAKIEVAQKDYQTNLLGISEEVHPFSLEDHTCRTADSVRAGLEKRAEALERIAAQPGILDHRSALRKFRAQIDALSSHLSFWWLWVEKILLGWSVDPATQQWLTGTLLPVLYWCQQRK